MNDIRGHWMPASEEDGNDYDPVPLFFRNLAQRLRERRTRLEDEGHPLGQLPVADARRRILEAR